MLKSKLHVTLSQASFKIENYFEELFPFVEIRQEKKKKIVMSLPSRMRYFMRVQFQIGTTFPRLITISDIYHKAVHYYAYSWDLSLLPFPVSFCLFFLPLDGGTNNFSDPSTLGAFPIIGRIIRIAHLHSVHSFQNLFQ